MQKHVVAKSRRLPKRSYEAQEGSPEVPQDVQNLINDALTLLNMGPTIVIRWISFGTASRT